MPIDLAKAVGAGGRVELWVSGTAYAKGQQVVSPSDLCVYIRKVAGAGATDPASDVANWQPFGARAIKSIQRGVSGTGNTTISAVDPTKTEVRVLGWSPPNSSSSTGLQQQDAKGFAGWVSLVDSTTLQCSFSSVGSFTNGQVSWELTEYY